LKIVVTGAAGFVGRHLCTALAGEGHDVVACHRPGAPPPPMNGVTWTAVDLSDPRSALPGADVVDAIVHLAQSRHYREFPRQASEIFEVNTSATLRLLEYGRARGASRFVHASTANVYAPARRPLDEDARLGASSFYAASKRAAELLVESYRALLGAVVLRFFTIYGPNQHGMLIPNLIARVRGREPITVQGRGGLPVSPLFVADAVTAIQAAVLEPARAGFEIFNVGGAEMLTIKDIGEAIGRALASPVRFEQMDGPDPSGWWCDSSRIAKRWSLAPAIDFARGLRMTLDA
jgi:UDP-glucose 4-epimerase